MCTSYEPTHRDDLESFDIFPLADFDYKREIYKDYSAPIFRRCADGYSTDAATFGIVPRKHIPPGVKVFDTMNARSESLGEKRSFSRAWKRLQLCLIPCRSFYEPNYETGKAVRWKIGMADSAPFAIAGLWRTWDEPEGTALSFTMLTVNSNEHPLMKRFHRPGDEKRSVVILPRTVIVQKYRRGAVFSESVSTRSDARGTLSSSAAKTRGQSASRSAGSPELTGRLAMLHRC
jgi:putative SOS response-associated peptidase YedK